MESIGVMGWDQPPVERIGTSQYFKHGLSPLFDVPSDKQDGITIGVSLSFKIIINLKLPKHGQYDFINKADKVSSSWTPKSLYISHFV